MEHSAFQMHAQFQVGSGCKGSGMGWMFRGWEHKAWEHKHKKCLVAARAPEPFAAAEPS